LARGSDFVERLTIPLIVTIIAVLITAVIDLWKFKIYNAVTFPLLISGVIYHGVANGSLWYWGVGESLLGVLFAIAILGPLVFLGGMGAGDVKLLAAIGAWLLLPLTFWIFVASALATGAYAVIVIVCCGRCKDTWRNLTILCHRLVTAEKNRSAEQRIEIAITKDDRRTRVIPFAVMVAVGMSGLLGMAWYLGNP
jgi:prepilin peptidase CpaA